MAERFPDMAREPPLWEAFKRTMADAEPELQIQESATVDDVTEIELVYADAFFFPTSIC